MPSINSGLGDRVCRWVMMSTDVLAGESFRTHWWDHAVTEWRAVFAASGVLVVGWMK